MIAQFIIELFLCAFVLGLIVFFNQVKKERTVMAFFILNEVSTSEQFEKFADMNTFGELRMNLYSIFDG